MFTIRNSSPNRSSISSCHFTHKPAGQTTSTVRASFDARSQQLFKLQGLVQRLAPNLHHWNRSVLFSVERLKQDTGWRPEYTFASAVEHTWEWFVREGLDRTREFDFSFEDEILALVER